MHVLITGPRGVGKSTLVRRLTAELGLPLFGFETKKEDALADERLGSPVYIYPAGEPRVQGEDNLVGHCQNKCFSTMKAAFDRFAPRLGRPVPPGHLVVLDELGFMESRSEAFCAAVLALLDGDAPVLAVVKDKHTPFLDAVRAHPKCRCFAITEEDRDARFEEILNVMRAQTEGGKEE